MIHLSATADSCVTQSARVEHIDWAKEVGIPISKGKTFFVITNAALAFDQYNRMACMNILLCILDMFPRFLAL